MRARRDSGLVRYACPIDITIDMIGRKWQPLVLCALYAGPLHYNSLLAALPEVAHKVLTQQLRALERNQIIARIERPDRACMRVEYELTEFGRTLKPVLRLMAEWGKQHHRRVGVGLEIPPAIKRRLALAV